MSPVVRESAAGCFLVGRIMARSGHTIQENMQARNGERLKEFMADWLDTQEQAARSTLSRFFKLSPDLFVDPLVQAQIDNWNAVLLGIAYLKNNLKPADPESQNFKGFDSSGSAVVTPKLA